MIHIIINDQPMEQAEPLSLEGLLQQLRHPLEGSALAVNQRVIPRDQWQDHWLQDGDEIVLFQAIAGG